MAAAALLAACGGVKEAKVGEARLAYADGTYDAPAEGPTVVILPGQPFEMPDTTGPVRVAIDWDVTFAEVWPLLQKAQAADTNIVLLVADDRQRTKAMKVAPPQHGTHIRMIVTSDGKACVNLPEVEEAKCVMTAQHRVDRAWVRDLIREAFRASNLHRVNIEVEPALRWHDVVRAVDGARTCCKDERMEVGLTTY
jgi:hypothetical protein